MNECIPFILKIWIANEIIKNGYYILNKTVIM